MYCFHILATAPCNCTSGKQQKNDTVAEAEDQAREELQEIFESIVPKFSQTLSSITSPKARSKFVNEFSDALNNTAELVLKNREQEYCLPEPIANSMIHVLPLLLREIETWHQTALKKMNPNQIDNDCWKRNMVSPLPPQCIGKASFSLPLAPTLWKPMETLLKDYGAECSSKPIYRTTSSTATGDECLEIPGMEYNCRTTAPNIQCKFKDEQNLVDAMALFRLPNDTRFYPADVQLGTAGATSTPEPFQKPIVVQVEGKSKGSWQAHGYLKLEERRFVVEYVGKAESVKITFHYSGTVNCTVDNVLQDKIDEMYHRALDAFIPSHRSCAQQIRSFRNDLNRMRTRGPRRVINRDRNVVETLPEHCRYIKKKTGFRLDSKVRWTRLVTRARTKYNAQYFDAVSNNERIQFYSESDVINFFQDPCNPYQDRTLTQYLEKRNPKNPQYVRVRVLVSLATPFVIEYRPPTRGKTIEHRGRMRFFTKMEPT